MSGNSLEWFDEAMKHANDPANGIDDIEGFKEVVTALAVLADENGKVSMADLEDYFGLEPGSLNF